MFGVMSLVKNVISCADDYVEYYVRKQETLHSKPTFWNR